MMRWWAFLQSIKALHMVKTIEIWKQMPCFFPLMVACSQAENLGHRLICVLSLAMTNLSMREVQHRKKGREGKKGDVARCLGTSLGSGMAEGQEGTPLGNATRGRGCLPWQWHFPPCSIVTGELFSSISFNNEPTWKRYFAMLLRRRFTAASSIYNHHLQWGLMRCPVCAHVAKSR